MKNGAILHGTAPEPFRPDGEAGATYMLATPTVEQAIRWRGAVHQMVMRLHGIDLRGNVAIGDKLVTLRAAARALLAEDEPKREAVLGVIEEIRERLQAVIARIEARESAEWADDAIEELTRAAEWPELLLDFAGTAMREHARYRELLAVEAALPSYWGLAGARLLVMDWEGLDMPCRRGPAGLDDASLNAIPERDLIRIGTRLQQMTELSRSQKKASPSPSGGASAGTPSSSGRKRAQASP